MLTLKHRLDLCAKRGALTTADLAVWLDLPYPTVRSYRLGRHVKPLESRLPQIEERLAWLETALKHDLRLPVPLTVRAAERQAYLRGVFRAARGR